MKFLVLKQVVAKYKVKVGYPIWKLEEREFTFEPDDIIDVRRAYWGKKGSIILSVEIPVIVEGKLSFKSGVISFKNAQELHEHLRPLRVQLGEVEKLILEKLQERDKIPAIDLAEELNVMPKTVFRSVKSLVLKGLADFERGNHNRLIVKRLNKEIEAGKKVDELEKALKKLELTEKDVEFYSILKDLLKDLDEINELQDKILEELDAV